jgi:hypothetical protein
MAEVKGTSASQGTDRKHIRGKQSAFDTQHTSQPRSSICRGLSRIYRAQNTLSPAWEQSWRSTVHP